MFSANSSQVSEDRLFVEDVFSTYLYTGTGSTLPINNGINLSGKGGLVWTKPRDTADVHRLFDTARGADKFLITNNTNSEDTGWTGSLSFTSSGFTLGTAFTTPGNLNNSGYTTASWTFRKAPKFFDVVTYTGNGASSRFLSHSLGSTPGCIIYKRTDSTSDWFVWHRNLTANDYFLKLNTTDAQDGSFAPFAGGPSATGFPVGHNSTYSTNTNGGTYVAYLFAHDATSDGIIQCGSYTGNGTTSGPVVDLGWEPQWLLIKNASDGAPSWQLTDVMRGMPVGASSRALYPNLSLAEQSNGQSISVSATGFQPTSSSAIVNGSGNTHIYIAIRRGPMRTPTSGTSVFSPNAYTSATGTTITTNFPVDAIISRARAISDDNFIYDRLRGLQSPGGGSSQTYLVTNTTAADATLTTINNSFDNTGYKVGSYYGSTSTIGWSFRRAPSFFDVVCYTGTGSAGAKNHNLGVVPELYIIKRRNSTASWVVGGSILPSSVDNFLLLNSTSALDTVSNAWQTPTSSTIGIGSALANDPGVNASGSTYVAYLFASCPGVSKVGSYTGNGSSQTINCGFAAGARFILIKRTDDTGNWIVLDTARGISSGNDPVLRLNTTIQEITGFDPVDPDPSGFIVNQEDWNINVNGATYIYLAVA